MNKIRVLLADDHPIFRDGLVALLENEEDMECVATANDGEEAIQLAQQLSPDVAVMDVAMPKTNGIEAAKQIRTVCPTIGILLISAYDDHEFVPHAIEAGVDGYLLKSIRRNELVNGSKK